METFRRKEALYLEIRSSHGSLMRLSSSHVMFVVQNEGVIPKTRGTKDDSGRMVCSLDVRKDEKEKRD